MNPVREIAYQVDPALWVRETLDMTPTPWQETFLRSPHRFRTLPLSRTGNHRQ